MTESELLVKLSVAHLQQIATNIKNQHPGIMEFSYWFEFREQLIKILCTKKRGAR